GGRSRPAFGTSPGASQRLRRGSTAKAHQGHTHGMKSKAPKARRPNMPGYGLVKGPRGLLPWKWAEQRLRKSHNYFIVTTRPGGAPHAMPVWGIWVDSVFYFSTGRTSRKAKNLAKNKRCVVCNERANE